MDRFVIRKDAREKKDKPDEENDDKAIISKVKKRKYQDEYLQYGFIASENDPSLPFCLICAKSFSNESMNPSKLIRHLEANHREQKNNPIGYFEKLRSNLQSQAKKFKKYVTTSDQAQIASYRIAQLLAKKKKPHAEAEEIVLPALKIAAECMLTNDAVEKFKNIPLSSKTIARRIEDLSDDIELQLNECFNDPSRKWAIQLDESIDISNKAQLLSFLRFVRGEMIVSEYFFCQELKQTITGKDIFEMVDTNVKKNNLKWENCVSVCTDGAPTMQGRKKGFVSHVVKKNQSVKIVHCMIHREVLVSKALPSILKDTLNEVVSVVNKSECSSIKNFCSFMRSNGFGLQNFALSHRSSMAVKRKSFESISIYES
jgi:hypothetical protein